MKIEKERRAIEYLKSFEPADEPYFLCYSGGKDSDCIRILAALAGVKHEIHHNLTTVDAPETVRYVKSIPDVIIDRPGKNMWQLIIDKGIPPTRLIRYCCKGLKEYSGRGRIKVTGVRREESLQRQKNAGVVYVTGKPKTTKRMGDEVGVDYQTNSNGGIILNVDDDKSRRFVEMCYRTTSTLVNPIVDWSTEEVWEFLGHYGCKSNPLYQCGKNRIGCIGCPMAGGKQQKREFALYPKYEQAYIRAFDKMLLKRDEKGFERGNWLDGEHVMRWWVGDNPAQITMDDLIGHYYI